MAATLLLPLLAAVALLGAWGLARRRAWAMWVAAGGALGLAMAAASPSGFDLPVVAAGVLLPPVLAFGLLALPAVALLVLAARRTEAGRPSPEGPALAAACLVVGFAAVVLGDLAAAMADRCTRIVWAEGVEALWVEPPPGCRSLTTRFFLPRPVGGLVAAALVALAAPLAARRGWAVALVGWFLFVLGRFVAQVEGESGPLLGVPVLVAAGMCAWAALRAQTIKGRGRIAAA